MYATVFLSSGKQLSNIICPRIRLYMNILNMFTCGYSVKQCDCEGGIAFIQQFYNLEINIK